MNNTLAEALSSFVRGHLSLSELRSQLGDSVTMDFDDRRSREVHFAPGSPLPTVGFTRAEVQGALKRFLSFELEAEELSDWAAVIRMLDSHFDLDPSDPDPDRVWDVIDQLMAPEVSGDLDRGRAAEVLRVLEGA